MVEDLAASVEWYGRNLGFRRHYDFELPGARASMIVRGDARLELYQVEGAVETDPGRRDVATVLRSTGINHLALLVEDLDAVVEDLQARAVEVAIHPTLMPNASGDRFAFIRDNEGALVELFEPAAVA
ncbi:catechol 2,3-dioxygenase-like lactoylglutathione lyase family enzyme [Sphingomonas sp. BK580]|nr:catechol 2,3-dioxygenase-like lactoylglutathione lyase family enzyme [Sphingomonas sp. BK580]